MTVYNACELLRIYFLCFQVIQCEGNTWKMVLIDENKAKGWAPPFFQKILCSNFFHTFFLLLIFANAITGAALSFKGQGQAPGSNKLDGFYYAEVTFIFYIQVVLYQVHASLLSFKMKCCDAKTERSEE